MCDLKSSNKLNSPIGVFDAGIGSYAIVEKIRMNYPTQDIIYLADRNNFPYGKKNYSSLLKATLDASIFLSSQGCSSIVLASNAPSIIVMKDLEKLSPIPILGIEPPIKSACELSNTKNIIVLGVESMISSKEFQNFLKNNEINNCKVYGENASSLVSLVEDFSFINDPKKTQMLVSNFMESIITRYPNVDTITMSSTHLPWLESFFKNSMPNLNFLDPADTVIQRILPHISKGSGTTYCIATENDDYTLVDFNRALQGLKTNLAAKLVKF